MGYDLTKPLVIGISSRALFNLEEENRIFEKHGLRAYVEYEKTHETEPLQPGSAFQLVKALLGLNKNDQQRVEVIIMSRNSPDTSLRIFNSIKHHGLAISRAALAGGAPLAPYLKAFHTDLFLSADAVDVKAAVDEGFAAAQIMPGPSVYDKEIEQIRIAFDGDAVLFSAESEKIYKTQGMKAFQENEETKADIPLPEGPFANFLKAIAHIQDEYEDRENSPIRTALVTSRNAPAHERPIKTLRFWGVRIDEAFFLGGIDKKEVLAAFGPHIFFDDQEIHTIPASEVVAAAIVPYRDGDDPTK